MNPVNIFAVSRITDETLFNIAEKHEADDKGSRKMRVHEIRSLRILTDSLTDCGMSMHEADGFYLGFTIPQIGKEFDLLKVTDRHCLNIELKSQAVSEEAILAQLRKNRHYLTHLGKRLLLYTVVTSTMTCYRLSLSDNLVSVDIREIADVVRKCNTAYVTDLIHSFRASEYLISPMSTPDKFIQGKYFLTPAQEQVKTELIRTIDSSEGSSSGQAEQEGSFFHITGRPGTGKTLLLYDLAKTLSGNGRSVIIRCGDLSEGERIITRELSNLDIITSDSISSASDLSRYNFILSDESHRLSVGAFSAICRSAADSDQICIFSSDPDSVLTRSEKERDIAGRIRSLPLRGSFELSERLRMNRELHSFIMTLRHITRRTDRVYDYKDVSVNYASDAAEAVKLINYFKSKDYVFINAGIPKPGTTHHDPQDPFADIAEEFDVHHIIGCEYDNVVMLMDSSFYYDEDGFLQGIPQPDPEYIYPNLFYHGITRVREKLALVILDAPELFRAVLGIIS